MISSVRAHICIQKGPPHLNRLSLERIGVPSIIIAPIYVSTRGVFHSLDSRSETWESELLAPGVPTCSCRSRSKVVQISKLDVDQIQVLGPTQEEELLLSFLKPLVLVEQFADGSVFLDVDQLHTPGR